MTVGCVVVSDRGDLYLPGCLKELEADSWLPHVIDDSTHGLGMAGAVRAGFQWALDNDCDYVLWWEEDFRFGPEMTTVPFGGMKYVLESRPELAQVVLKRQPWNFHEQQCGGIIEANPTAYTEHSSPGQHVHWTEHREIFSLNPCLIPRRVLELGWPDGNEAEFTERCLTAGLRFAFYGKKYDPPLVEHIGFQRGEGWRL